MADQNESDLLAALEATKISEDDSNELVKKNQTLQELFRKAIDSLKEKNNVCLNLEKQNKALNLQVNFYKNNPSSKWTKSRKYVLMRYFPLR